LIDDNIGLRNDIPLVIGNDSPKGITDTFFNTLTGTSATTNFFTFGHNDLLHDVLDFNGLTSAVTTMQTQKDVDGRIFGIQPTVLMVPAALEFAARRLLNSVQLFRDQMTDFQPSGNSLQGIKLQLAIEPSPWGSWEGSRDDFFLSDLRPNEFLKDK
jgi:phage major head subunit gpT-like protein